MEGCPAPSPPFGMQLGLSPSAAPPAPISQRHSGAQGRNRGVEWVAWTDLGNSRCLANVSFAMATKQLHAHTPACMDVDSGLLLFAHHIPAPFCCWSSNSWGYCAPQLATALVYSIAWHMEVALEVGARRWRLEVALGGGARRRHPVVSQAKKPQTKGESESHSVGKVFWKQGGTEKQTMAT